MPNSDIRVLQETADQLGVRDIFILRRVEGDRFVHVGGAGRGEGWAGLTEIRLRDNATAREAYDETRVARVGATADRHVFGPYWSKWAAFVPVDHDVMVVFGEREHRATEVEPKGLESAALKVVRGIETVSPAKRLADELEMLHAIQKLMAIEPESVAVAMQHIVDCATEALSCEFGIAWMRHDGAWAASRRGWNPEEDAETGATLHELLSRAEAAPICVQNASRQPLPQPFHADDGVCSYYLLPIGSQALLLLVHTRVQPRGFTQLCQELGRRLAESSEILLRTAMQREELARELDRVSREARRDPLTGIANRLAWEEYLAELAAAPSSRCVGVLYLDLDNLKRVNDKLGHRAGDNIIRAMADVLRDHLRPHDLAARIGGDEFAALLPDANQETCAGVLQRLRAAADAGPKLDGHAIQFTYGCAVCEPGGDIYDTLQDADASLIEAKRSRES